MTGASDLPYLYARLCGSLRNSWLGPRSEDLLAVTRLGDLWRVLFGEAAPSLTEKYLIAALESKVLEGVLTTFLDMAGAFEGSQGLALAVARKPEYARVKRILVAVRDKEAACPGPLLPGQKESFDSSAYPRLGAMFKTGRFSWIDEPALLDLPATENRLDRQFYAELWAAIRGLSERNREGLERLFLQEVELANSLWALRLARYYAMGPEAIAPLLIHLGGTSVQAPALALLERHQDRRADWKGWKYEALIPGSGEPWRLDLPGLEKRLKAELCRKARLALHLNPESCAPLYAWFLLKEAEASLVLGCAEALALGAPRAEVEAFVMAGRLS